MLSRQPRQTDEEPRRSSRSTLIVAVLVAVFVLYLLSIGPVVWLAERDVFSGSTVKAIENGYYPLVVVAEKAGAEGALFWYIGLWIKPETSWDGSAKNSLKKNL